MAAGGRQPKSNIREYRKQLAALKRAGLVSSRVDARSHKPTEYMRRQIRKYSDVLEGRAKTAKAHTAASARTVAEQHEQILRKGKTLIVPVSDKTARVSVLKGGKIKVTQKVSGKRRSYIMTPSNTLPALKRNQRYRFTFPNQVGSWTFDNAASLEAFMKLYEAKGFKDWRKYVGVFEVGELDDDE